MRRVFLLFFVMMVLPSVGMATGSEDVGVNWSVDAGFLGKKVLSGGLNVYDEPFFKTVLTANLSNGYVLDVYHSTALQGACLENSKCGSVQEWDAEVGKLWKIKPAYSVLGMVSYFVIGDRVRKNSYQVRSKIGHDLGEGLPVVYADVKWIDLVGDQQQGGFITHFGLEGTWKITPQFSVPAWADVTHDGLPFEENGFLARFGFLLRYNLSSKYIIGVGVNGHHLVSNFTDRRDEVVPRIELQILIQ